MLVHNRPDELAKCLIGFGHRKITQQAIAQCCTCSIQQNDLYYPVDLSAELFP